jgi:apolipoprotein N-acyltransferase
LLEVPNLPPFSPLICYEAIFPGSVTDGSGRAKWLLNVSNDAWFGRSIGPYQHFAMARIRAVEEGVSLVRAANTGISGVIDPYGRVIGRLELNQTGVIDSGVPPALHHPTPFARVGNGNVAALVLLGWLVALMSRPPSPTPNPEP